MLKEVTQTELEAGLAVVGNSPQDGGTVEMIVARPTIDERRILESAEIDLVAGMVGDNWLARGSSQTEDGSAHPEAQITLMNSRIIQLLAQDQSRWPIAGDQFYVDFDISVENLPPGQRIAIGTAILEATEKPHTGCAKFTARFGHDAIRFVNSPEGLAMRRRGINMRVIQPGTVHLGDKITKLPSGR